MTVTLHYKLSDRSKEKLSECHVDLQKVFNFAIKHWPFRIIEGHRGKELQNLYYEQGTSKIQWPLGDHNQVPSMAVDALLEPINWGDWNRFYSFAHFIVGISVVMYENNEIGHLVGTGLDWDHDRDFKDQRLHDAPHFFLYKP